MAFTSIFRNLKNGGEVKSQFWQLFEKANKPLTAPIAYKNGGEVKSGFFYNLSKNPEMMKLIQKAGNQPKPIAKKEGGVVEARTPFQQAIHDTFLKAAGGGGIHYRKKGGVVKKTKAPIAKKKGKKKGKDKK